MFKRLIISLFLTLSAALTPVSGLTQDFDSLDDVAKFSLLPGWRTEHGTHMAGLRIKLAKGWKTYWRAPGDAGIPPQFDWTGSQNLKAVRLFWPTPKVFETAGFRSIGYSGVTVIPIELTPITPENPVISVSANLALGVCDEICVPVTIDLSADFSNTGTPDQAIRASLAHRPQGATEAGVGAVTCAFYPIADGLRIRTSIELPRQCSDEVVIIELSDPSIWVSQANTKRRGNTLTATSDLVPPNGKPFLLNRSEVRITVLGNGNGVDIRGCRAS